MTDYVISNILTGHVVMDTEILDAACSADRSRTRPYLRALYVVGALTGDAESAISRYAATMVLRDQLRQDESLT